MKKIREFNLVCMNVTVGSKKADFTEFFGENFYYLSTLRQKVTSIHDQSIINSF